MYDVLLYGMLELALGLEHEVDNPYDPAEIVVDVEVAGPEGESRTWPAYFDGQAWMFRYRPLNQGEHSAVILQDGEAGVGFPFHVHELVVRGSRPWPRPGSGDRRCRVSLPSAGSQRRLSGKGS